MDARRLDKLSGDEALIEFHSILMTKVLFPASMSREAVINELIGLMSTSNYDCHEIENLPDGSTRLIIHLDS